MKILIYTLTAVFLALGYSSAEAHHSFQATFKSDAKIAVDGVVTKFSFRNPHVLVYFNVTNDDGSITKWVAEGAAATLMRRVDWSRDTVKKGDRIRIHGDSTHDGSPMVAIDSIDMLDQESGAVVRTLKKFSGPGSTPTKKAAAMPLKLADGRPNLTGAWSNHGMASGRPGPPKVKFSDAGKIVDDKYDKANDPQIFCEPPGLVRQLNTPHPIRITQFDDRVLFEYEEYAGRREVPLGDTLPADGPKSHFGDSVARYEGQALIVESKNLLANPSSPEGHWVSDETTTVETYVREDSDKYGPVLMIRVAINDDVYLAETGSITRAKMSAGEYEFIENDCRPPLRKRDAAMPTK